MWKLFKHKLKRMFDSETLMDEVQPKNKMNSRNTNSVHTKMSYQYPKEKPFNFPVIPDSPKTESDYSHNSSDQLEKKRYVEDVQVNYRDSKEEKSCRKFEPSDVPSPIFGFNQRTKSINEVEEIPAYLRKKDTLVNEHEDMLIPVKEKSTVDSYNAHQDNLYPNNDEKIEVEKDSSNLKEVSSGTSQVEQKNETYFSKSETTSLNEEIINRDSTHNKEIKKREIEPKQDVNRGKKTAPFNVIMTPRDKKSRLVKQADAQKTQINNSEKQPPMYLLNDQLKRTHEDQTWVKQQTELLETTLKHFHVRAKVVNAMSGPAVTRFEIQPDPGVKVSKIKNLSDDIKLNMSARDIRMEAPIPGKNTIGIEIPNPVSQAVGLHEIFETRIFQDDSSPLLVALGLDIAGKAKVTDLKKMPHGLIAGATGSGKSVCINTILISLLYKASHEDVRFLLIDPKMVELAPYNDLPHLVSPVITDVKAATSALKWAVAEMEERYEKFVKEGARDIERYNQKMLTQNRNKEKLPYLVIVIDELADLMMAAPQDVEDAICRIAQKARACGIHLLLATQRPSVDVITGLIKANIPTRIAFSVSSQVDSRTILDSNGAEKLLGKGDMLFLENGVGQSVRIQGAFVSDEEIERVTNFVKKTAPPQYLFEQDQLLQILATDEDEGDEIYLEAVDFVVQQKGASASLLQRRFKIGYNRAARLIDHMEANGIISEQKGSKPRDILITTVELDQLLYGTSDNVDNNGKNTYYS
ncbi:DNA translocase FtsK [Aquibacillus halophilus]|uniref:DNA translocase FtsK n=1 Tax=Aquibacillus halophilus TaxID=930132 RepID=A0A6A8DNK0_9BACI|nr:DNA translocase FtsK [Aquibacillus halophilus]MRH42822.1 DNA translocase FtsK [Aquibacillus halophilus]